MRYQQSLLFHRERFVVKVSRSILMNFIARRHQILMYYVSGNLFSFPGAEAGDDKELK